MITKKFQNITLSRLGLGNMRLPKISPAKEDIDYPKAFEIIDYAYRNGINYYDTAYVYNNGDSEKCLGECMKKYPRDSFYLASKFFIQANPDYRAVFEEQLRRLQTDHIDFYLIHCLNDGNIDRYLDSGAIEFFLEKKKEGKISYLGFSSHASVGALERFADAAEWDFVQIQLNYYDWYYGTAKEEYEALTKRNIPVVVMEPVRGGKLAALTQNAEALLKQAHPEWSIASWALRFVKSLPGVQVILSGMSDLDQISDNINNTFSDEEGLTETDRKILKEAAELFKHTIQVPCTSCRYCISDCPEQINIPEFMKVYNTYKVDGEWGLKEMADGIESDGKPADCIKCGSCMDHCPQNIRIPDILEKLTEVLK